MEFRLAAPPEKPTVHHHKSSRKHPEGLPEYSWEINRQTGEVLEMTLSNGNAIQKLEGLNAAQIVEKLNASSCFDVPYSPQENDGLVIRGEGEHSDVYLEFSFVNGEWQEGCDKFTQWHMIRTPVIEGNVILLYHETIAAYDKLAGVYQEKFMDLDLYNDTYDLFCSVIVKRSATILELACGPGNITKYISARRPDFKILATDGAPQMVALAKANNPGVECRVLNIEEVASLPEKFDGIVCGFCMPYLSKSDCIKLIRDCSGLLDSDGIFYFSTIEGDYEKSGYETGSTGDAMYIYYHGEEYLLQALEENGFELISLLRKSYTSTSHISPSHMIFIARKK
jgi:2-polyprenyl-3-methyl-5-hydroxy-6-metoxy-1,4-benzoquinol methylase